ncbi:type II toxin-antitoxin system RelE family toxin [Pseudanabaena sp. ABRG5-3]|uniref:type II toxin-antitoxin system RelE family toxin n=1 Tax=Pseudanabaena sp. ABRG5-3 TaxID=685565 RepID=UPI000DC6DB55|nr:type II toxin-antitoxin system RelE/ParE family toxin [Pseudanabaena sp. ABRG5-3]BBC22678.1 plasmid stabilization system [Pseudanabaena sp. ABRG5-3]
MSYRIVIPKPAQKQLDNITKIERDRLIVTLRSLADDPRPNGVKKLKGYDNIYRVRIGDYRIIYEIKDRELIVLLLSVSHRKDAY